MYSDAHDLAVLELAPDAVIRQDLSLLKDLFIRFEGHPVEGWHVGGKVIDPLRVTVFFKPVLIQYEQVFLGYVDISVRMPQLRNQLNSGLDIASDASVELERLSRSALKMIGMVLDVLRKREDVRHTAAIEVMTAQLTLQLDKNKRFAVQMVRVDLFYNKSVFV